MSERKWSDPRESHAIDGLVCLALLAGVVFSDPTRSIAFGLVLLGESIELAVRLYLRGQKDGQ